MDFRQKYLWSNDLISHAFRLFIMLFSPSLFILAVPFSFFPSPPLPDIEPFQLADIIKATTQSGVNLTKLMLDGRVMGVRNISVGSLLASTNVSSYLPNIGLQGPYAIAIIVDDREFMSTSTTSTTTTAIPSTTTSPVTTSTIPAMMTRTRFPPLTKKKKIRNEMLMKPQPRWGGLYNQFNGGGYGGGGGIGPYGIGLGGFGGGYGFGLPPPLPPPPPPPPLGFGGGGIYNNFNLLNSIGGGSPYGNLLSPYANGGLGSGLGNVGGGGGGGIPQILILPYSLFTGGQGVYTAQTAFPTVITVATTLIPGITTTSPIAGCVGLAPPAVTTTSCTITACSAVFGGAQPGTAVCTITATGGRVPYMFALVQPEGRYSISPTTGQLTLEVFQGDQSVQTTDVIVTDGCNNMVRQMIMVNVACAQPVFGR